MPRDKFLLGSGLNSYIHMHEEGNSYKEMPADGQWDMLVYYQPRPFLESYLDYSIEVTPGEIENILQLREALEIVSEDDQDDGVDIFNSPLVIKKNKVQKTDQIDPHMPIRILGLVSVFVMLISAGLICAVRRLKPHQPKVIEPVPLQSKKRKMRTPTPAMETSTFEQVDINLSEPTIEIEFIHDDLK